MYLRMREAFNTIIKERGDNGSFVYSNGCPQIDNFFL